MEVRNYTAILLYDPSISKNSIEEEQKKIFSDIMNQFNCEIRNFVYQEKKNLSFPIHKKLSTHIVICEFSMEKNINSGHFVQKIIDKVNNSIKDIIRIRILNSKDKFEISDL